MAAKKSSKKKATQKKVEPVVEDAPAESAPAPTQVVSYPTGPDGRKIRRGNRTR